MGSKAKPWALPKHRGLLLSNVHIVDPAAGTVHHDRDVMISPQGKIAAISDDADDFDVLFQYDVADLQGLYLCPGLIDCHVHLAAAPGEDDMWSTFNMPPDVSLLRQPYYAREMLRRGFTTVRDCGGATLAFKQAIDEGLFPGPRVFFAGKALSQTGGHGDLRGAHETGDLCTATHMRGLGRICDGVEECLRAARDELRRGADFIKIMAGGGVASPTDALDHVQFNAEEVRAITRAAANSGKIVTAHAYTPQSIKHSIENGCMGIEHGNLIDEECAALMKDRGAWLTPTLVTYEAMKATEGFLPPNLAEKNAVVLEKGLEGIRVADRAGVDICYGTDLLGPLTHWQSQEFALRAKVLSSLKVLQSATVTPAKMLGRAHSLGQIRRQFSADMIVLKRNPLEDVTILSKPEENVLAVIKEGIVYESALKNLHPHRS